MDYWFELSKIKFKYNLCFNIIYVMINYINLFFYYEQ